MLCKHCGGVVDSECNFCPSCGAPVGNVNSQAGTLKSRTQAFTAAAEEQLKAAINAAEKQIDSAKDKVGRAKENAKAGKTSTKGISVLVAILVLMGGFFIVRGLVREPVLGTWTAKEVCYGGEYYSIEDFYGDDGEITMSFGTGYTVTVSDGQYGRNDTLDGRWDKISRGEYSVRITYDYTETSHFYVYVKGDTLTLTVPGDDGSIIFKKA